MRKILVIVFSLVIGMAFSQSPGFYLRVAATTTVFGIDLPIGTLVYEATGDDLYMLPSGGINTASLSTVSDEILVNDGVGTGTVTTSGTPAADYIAFFSGATEITGVSGFSYDSDLRTMSVTAVSINANPSNDEEFSGLVASMTATTSVTQNYPVSQTSTANTVINADSDAASTMRIVGLATASANSGSVVILIEGYYTNTAWSWTAGSALYVSSTGGLTATAPTAGYAKWVATAVDANTVYFHNKGSLLGL